MTSAIWPLAGLALGVAAGYFVRRYIALSQAGSIEKKAELAIADADKKSKEIVAEAEKKAADVLSEIKKQERERQTQIASLENRLMSREEALDKKLAGISQEESALRSKNDKLDAEKADIEKLRAQIQGELEKVSGLTREKAVENLLNEIRETRSQEFAEYVRKMEKENRGTEEKKSMEVIATALQRYARSHVAEITTTNFHVTDEDIKGKIIGREGRNIRALERATGVEFVIDEAPDTIVISSFDPYRREVARMALDKLVKDGRIQPAKIEEKVEESKQELNKRIADIGEAAAAEVGVYDLPKEIMQLLGRLHFRTSFGQNVLTHSVEMAHVAGMLAAELGLNREVAKRGALLHDIGKAIDQEVEGTHVELGRKLLKKYNIDENVVLAMQSHHEDYPYAIPEAYIVTAADVLSAGRPGARRGTLENYIKRLGDLEKIAMEFPGVKSAYAISAGRELRVFVVPEKVDDFRALELAREIATKIQSELKYPGEIKVNVIREMRAVEYAR